MELQSLTHTITQIVRFCVLCTVLSPGDAILLVSGNAQVTWPLTRSQNKLGSCVERLLSSFVCSLSGNTNRYFDTHAT